MNDTIYRRDAIQALVDTKEIKGFAYRMLEDRLIGLPSAHSLQGEWIDDEFLGQYRCSECDYYSVDEFDYCPNCGCRMKGADDE